MALRAEEERASLLERTAAHAVRYLAEIGERQAGALAGGAELRRRLAKPLPENGDDAFALIDELANAGWEGTIASQGPRYFGFVTGGSVPAATAADWLTSAWDQNAQVYAMSPIASVVEEIAAGWIKDLLGLPTSWSAGFVTGAQMASFTGLLLGRSHVLRAAGWDVERDGLFGAPPIDVIVSGEAHRTIFTALRMLGLGERRVRRVATDEQGRMLVPALARELHAVSGPSIVCAQAGNVNTGACDPIEAIAALARERNAWLHVDGAFGAWAAVSDAHRYLTAGIARADSIATDAHKWLNVPYDSGIVLTAYAELHARTMVVPAHYIAPTPGERDARSFIPDESRRARGIAVYAALRSLGRRGVAEIVERCCGLARRAAAALNAHPQVRVLNDVVLNQVLVQFVPDAGDPRDASAFTAAVIAGVQAEGTCWLGGTIRRGERLARISICNWSTTTADIDRSVDAIAHVIERVNEMSRDGERPR